MRTVPDPWFQAVYYVAVVFVVVFYVQSVRYARENRTWGSVVVAGHFACKLAFVADLAVIRMGWVSTHDIFGANGTATFVIRVLWAGTLGLLCLAAWKGAILRHVVGGEPEWDGTERRHHIRRQADRERMRNERGMP